MRRIVHFNKLDRTRRHGSITHEAWLDETLIRQDWWNGGECVLYNGHLMSANAAKNAAGGSGNGWMFWSYQLSDGSWAKIKGIRDPEWLGRAPFPTVNRPDAPARRHSGLSLAKVQA